MIKRLANIIYWVATTIAALGVYLSFHDGWMIFLLALAAWGLGWVTRYVMTGVMR